MFHIKLVKHMVFHSKFHMLSCNVSPIFTTNEHNQTQSWVCPMLRGYLSPWHGVSSGCR